MSTSANEMRLKLLGVAIALGIVSCAVAVNAPRPVVVPRNVVNRPAPAPAPVATVVPGPRLPHPKHIDLGLACADCHEIDEDTGAMSYPEVDFCLDCHQDMQEEDEVPEAKRIENVFFQDGKPRWHRALVPFQGDVHFSHKPHVGEKLECTACHDMSGMQRLAKPVMDMAACTECHRSRGAPHRCETCHLQTRADVAPPSHAVDWEMRHGGAIYAAEQAGQDPTCQYCHGDAKFCNDCHQGRKPSSHGFDWQRRHGQVVWQAGGPAEARCTFCHRDPNYCEGCHQTRKPDSHQHLWLQRHGALARAADMSGMARCTFCHHEPAWCENCHRDTKPRDHTALFRTKTHGLQAAMDRTRCSTCHDPDFCVRCHEGTAPRSHRGLWARSQNTHCMQCHFPIQREPQCVVCHKESPAHDTAPPQPPGHNPASNCRSCHHPVGGGGSAPSIPHVDPGFACQHCHN